MATLVCTVRGCRETLAAAASGLSCPRGHHFDRARRGWFNLLQPQHRHAREPGDSAEALAARARLHARGLNQALVAALRERIAPLLQGSRPALLDAGAGEGSLLLALALAPPALDPGVELWGVDLSRRAIEAAARRLPRAGWVVANIDHGLPWADGGFDVVLSVNARLNPLEMHRLLRPGGRLVVATPAPDDLVELRGALLGEARPLALAQHGEQLLAGSFAIQDSEAVRERHSLDRDGIADALAATYRQRASRCARAAAIDSLEVTFSWQLLCLRPLGDKMGSSPEEKGP